MPSKPHLSLQLFPVRPPPSLFATALHENPVPPVPPRSRMTFCSRWSSCRQNMPVRVLCIYTCQACPCTSHTGTTPNTDGQARQHGGAPGRRVYPNSIALTLDSACYSGLGQHLRLPGRPLALHDVLEHLVVPFRCNSVSEYEVSRLVAVRWRGAMMHQQTLMLLHSV